MARLAPRVIFSPMFDLQTRVLMPLVSPSTVWIVQQSLRRLHQPPAPPGLEKTGGRVVISTRESLQIVEDILSAGQPVGLDGEGVNHGPKGKLSLLQVSRLGGEVVIFDVQTNPALITQGGLKSLLESEHIIKVREGRGRRVEHSHWSRDL